MTHEPQARHTPFSDVRCVSRHFSKSIKRILRLNSLKHTERMNERTWKIKSVKKFSLLTYAFPFSSENMRKMLYKLVKLHFWYVSTKKKNCCSTNWEFISTIWLFKAPQLSPGELSASLIQILIFFIIWLWICQMFHTIVENIFFSAKQSPKTTFNITNSEDCDPRNKLLVI